MSRLLKWVLRGVGILLALAAIAAMTIYILSESSLNQTFDIPADPIPISDDAANIERGKHLVTTVGFCQDCHGEKLEGKVLEDDPVVGRLTAPNLTTGKGGVGSRLTDADWIRAIRHGVSPSGKPLIAMASNTFYYFGDADLEAIVAYMRHLPPVDNEVPDTWIGPMARVLVLMQPDVLAAQVIDHAAPRPAAPPPGRTVEYGQYLSYGCRNCHGDDLAGKEGDGGGANLTPGGNLRQWTETDFVRALRTGITPEGRSLDNDMMPWRSVGRLTDDELGAIWLYLASRPRIENRFPTPTPQRK